MRRRAVLMVLMLATVGSMVVVAPVSGAQGATEYETDFADPAQAASEWGFPDGETSMTEDGFSAEITPGDLAVSLDGAPNAWLSPDVSGLPTQLAVEAEVTSNTGDASALFGVACRAKLHSAGYAFLVGTDGYYTIGRFDHGKAKALVNAKGTATTAAVNASAPNTVRGECTGKKKVSLALFVNGEKVATAVDPSPPKLGQRAFVVTEVERGKQTTTDFASFAVTAL